MIALKSILPSLALLMRLKPITDVCHYLDNYLDNYVCNYSH